MCVNYIVRNTNNTTCAGGHAKREHKRREHHAGHLLQKQHRLVLKQLLKLLLHLARVGASSPVPRQVVRVRHHLHHRQLGVKRRTRLHNHAAAHRQQDAQCGDPPHQVAPVQRPLEQLFVHQRHKQQQRHEAARDKRDKARDVAHVQRRKLLQEYELYVLQKHHATCAMYLLLASWLAFKRWET